MEWSSQERYGDARNDDVGVTWLLAKERRTDGREVRAEIWMYILRHHGIEYRIDWVYQVPCYFCFENRFEFQNSCISLLTLDV